jgi:hypothetical protein
MVGLALAFGLATILRGCGGGGFTLFMMSINYLALSFLAMMERSSQKAQTTGG